MPREGAQLPLLSQLSLFTLWEKGQEPILGVQHPPPPQNAQHAPKLPVRGKVQKQRPEQPSAHHNAPMGRCQLHTRATREPTPATATGFPRDTRPWGGHPPPAQLQDAATFPGRLLPAGRRAGELPLAEPSIPGSPPRPLPTRSGDPRSGDPQRSPHSPPAHPGAPARGRRATRHPHHHHHHPPPGCRSPRSHARLQPRGRPRHPPPALTWAEVPPGRGPRHRQPLPAG